MEPEPHSNGANVGHEAQLWQMADALRGNMDAAEYKHVVLGLIFLKYISDAFEEQHAKLVSRAGERRRSGRPRRIPRRKHLLGPKGGPLGAFEGASAAADDRQARRRGDGAHRARQPGTQGRPAQGLCPARRSTSTRLGQLIDLIGNIGLGDEAADRAKTSWAESTSISCRNSPAPKGKRAAQFYTPRCVVRVLVEMLGPIKGRVYDPCCGSGGMFVQSARSSSTPMQRQRQWRQGSRHLDLRPGVELHDLAARQDEPRHSRHRRQIAHGDTFHHDLHPDLKADYVLANPPFNDSDWRGELLREDKRWDYGVPPPATPISPGCSTSSITWHRSGLPASCSPTARCRRISQVKARFARDMVEADLVDCMVALPGQLFYSTQIPVCLWFLARDKQERQVPRPPRPRRSSSTPASSVSSSIASIAN